MIHTHTIPKYGPNSRELETYLWFGGTTCTPEPNIDDITKSLHKQAHIIDKRQFGLAVSGGLRIVATFNCPIVQLSNCLICHSRSQRNVCI